MTAAGPGVHTTKSPENRFPRAGDVRAICAELGIDRLAMWGMSGGGPHVLACAALLPDLVTAVASLASVAPYGADGRRASGALAPHGEPGPVNNYYAGGLELKGNGVNKPATIAAAPGNCFNLYSKFTYSFDGTTYTGYEYQNGDGHCLWDNGGIIELGAACKAGHPNEEFFGIGFSPGAGGWLMGSVTYNPDIAAVGANSLTCASGATVEMLSRTGGFCTSWNFPS
jgi:pimeloyl-ACP methyl ester carboxylesterase